MTFEEVYNKHYRSIRTFIWRRLKNDADADDVLQETFIQFLRVMDRIEEREEYRGFLKQTARFAIGTFRSKQARMIKTDPIEDTDNFSYEPRKPVLSRSSVLEKIWRLKRLYRRSVVMYFFADMTFEEIGKAMGSGISTAEYRVKAGIKQLRNEF